MIIRKSASSIVNETTAKGNLSNRSPANEGGSGNSWNDIIIVQTLIVSCLIAVFLVWHYFKVNKKPFYRIFSNEYKCKPECGAMDPPGDTGMPNSQCPPSSRNPVEKLFYTAKQDAAQCTGEYHKTTFTRYPVFTTVYYGLCKVVYYVKVGINRVTSPFKFFMSGAQEFPEAEINCPDKYIPKIPCVLENLIFSYDPIRDSMENLIMEITREAEENEKSVEMTDEAFLKRAGVKSLKKNKKPINEERSSMAQVKSSNKNKG